jgi:hypothetical protein
VRIYDAGLAAFLGMWLVLSVAAQTHLVSAKASRIVGRDRLKALPLYHFFAPNPVVADFHLLYRLRDTAGVRTEWVDTTPQPRWSLLHAVWNPDRRYRKQIIDVTRDLGRDSHTRDDSTVADARYVLLLRHMSRFAEKDARFTPGSRVQCAVVLTRTTHDRPQIYFLSREHTLR